MKDRPKEEVNSKETQLLLIYANDFGIEKELNTRPSCARNSGSYAESISHDQITRPVMTPLKL